MDKWPSKSFIALGLLLFSLPFFLLTKKRKETENLFFFSYNLPLVSHLSHKLIKKKSIIQHKWTKNNHLNTAENQTTNSLTSWILSLEVAYCVHNSENHFFFLFRFAFGAFKWTVCCLWGFFCGCSFCLIICIPGQALVICFPFSNLANYPAAFGSVDSQLFS